MPRTADPKVFSIVKRAPLVLGVTAAGVAAVLSFHTHSAPLTLTNSAINALNSASSASTGSTSKTGWSSNATATSTTAPSHQTSTSNDPSSSSSTATSTTVPPSTTTTVPSTSTRSANGPSEFYNYGTISVTVSESSKKITNVQIASLSDGGDFRSQSIDEQAIPILEQEAISAQSANIQSVSGATYTSEGFITSLQGALSKLGL